LIVKWLWLWFGEQIAVAIDFALPISEYAHIPIHSNDREKIGKKSPIRLDHEMIHRRPYVVGSVNA
jgi:hypothetical protein